MSAIANPILASALPTPAWAVPSRGRVGMVSLICAEAAMFTIFVVAYLFYAGKSLTGPTPQEVLAIPVFSTICLLASSVTVHLAVRALDRATDGRDTYERAANGRAATPFFGGWWLATILLGAAFLYGTAREWQHLIRDEGLTIQTNLFGTTYYSLVGLHALHVTVGLLALAIVWLLWLRGHVEPLHAARLDVLSLYWHFVDVVWVVVLLVVYVVAR
jgi:cytochrome c oxidase subunit 3/cytochrome o ubiquinol oxidase subunit 3